MIRLLKSNKYYLLFIPVTVFFAAGLLFLGWHLFEVDSYFYRFANAELFRKNSEL